MPRTRRPRDGQTFLQEFRTARVRRVLDPAQRPGKGSHDDGQKCIVTRCTRMSQTLLEERDGALVLALELGGVAEAGVRPANAALVADSPAEEERFFSQLNRARIVTPHPARL